MRAVAAARQVEVVLRVESSLPDVAAEASLELPVGWTASPASIRHEFQSRGQVFETTVTITPPVEWSGEALLHAVARTAAAGIPREYRTGYQVIDHRDLPLARLRIPARTAIRSVAAAPLDGVAVGYAMGCGGRGAGPRSRPSALPSTPLDDADLTGGDLNAYDAIVIGTRAYAVRRDLVENNQRLIDYARRGGNVVVLYQTQEFVPAEMAPYPATLPPRRAGSL